MVIESSEQTTRTPDVVFNLISVAYHALQGIDTCEKYRKDVEGNEAMSSFFDSVIEQHRRIAERAKNLLHDQLMRGEENEGETEEPAEH